MPDKILLNNFEHHFNENDLPCLISYGEKMGGSHFSVTLVADLFLRGSKILFLTAYPMAKDNFLEQLKGHESKIEYITDKSQLNTTAQAIILESGNEKLYLQSVKQLKDLNERVVLIKNMEVFSGEVFNHCLGLSKVILSGDIDKCVAKAELSKKQFKTTILFSKPEIKLPFDLPVLEKYTGYMWSGNRSGLVKVQKV